jgi:hypothetical protein
MTRTGQTVHMKVIIEEITAVKVSGEISIEIVSEKAVSKVVDLIINIIYYHRSLDKRSAIYIINMLNTL